MLRVAERSRLSVLVLRRWSRQLASRIAYPIARWRLWPGKADRLVIAPQDLRTADATRAAEIYAGRFVFAGKIVICDGRSPFDLAPVSDEWAAALLGFSWLRHLRAADSGITRANARALIDEWIRLQGSWNATAWRIDVLSRALRWMNAGPQAYPAPDALRARFDAAGLRGSFAPLHGRTPFNNWLVVAEHPRRDQPGSTLR